jgi:hypothetical protein
MATTTRFDHSNCGHPLTGSEGKKARAKCRKAHAEEAAKAAEGKKPARKASTTAKPRAPRKAAAPKAKATTAPAKDAEEVDLVGDLA